MKVVLVAVILAVAPIEGFVVAGKTEILTALDQVREATGRSIKYVKDETKYWENGSEISVYLEHTLIKTNTLFDIFKQEVTLNGLTLDTATKTLAGLFDIFIQTNYKLGRLFFPTMQTYPKTVEVLVKKIQENLNKITFIFGPLFATVFPDDAAYKSWTVFTTSRIIALRSLEFIKTYADDWPAPSMMRIVINRYMPDFTYNFDKMVEHYGMSNKDKAQTDYISIEILYEKLIDYSFPRANNWYYDKQLSPVGTFDFELFKSNFRQMLQQLGQFLFQ